MPCRASTLSSAVNSLSSTGISFSRMDEKEKQQALEEEQARLQALKVTSPLFQARPPPLFFSPEGPTFNGIHQGFSFIWVHCSPLDQRPLAGADVPGL